MTTREHREYSSSNVVRTLSPGSSSHPVKVDRNLDYLLDDLQNSVERTKSTDRHFLSPATNSSTVVRERSVSPGGGESRRVYKTAHYEYSSSTAGGPSAMPAPSIAGRDVQQNINSLDSLLLDLKHERERSLERAGETTYSNVGIDDGLLEPLPKHHQQHQQQRTSTTTRNYATGAGSPAGRASTTTAVNRELHFDAPSPQGTTTTKTTTVRQSRSRQRSPLGYETVQRDVSYESPDPSTTTRTSTLNRSTYNTLSSQQPQQVVPYNEHTEYVVEEVDAAQLPNELGGLPLASGILPGPGTKVTTTIKTFTYEIPGETTVPVNQSYNYKTDTYNSNTTHNNNNNTVHYPPAERDIPSPLPIGGTTSLYKNESYNTVNRTTTTHGQPHQQPYGHDVPPPRRSVSPLPPPLVNKSLIVKRETHNTSSTTQNAYPPAGSLVQPQPPPPGTNTTYVYKEDIRNTNTNTVHGHPPNGGVVYEPPQVPAPNVGNGPPTTGPKQTYMYKREVTNTKNTVYGAPQPQPLPLPPHDMDGHPGRSPQPLVEYPTHQPRHPSPGPGGNTQYVYNYSNTTTNRSTRNVHGYPPGPDDGRQPLMPFPVDGRAPPAGPTDGNPPKRLDDLLATFGDTNGHGPNHRGGIEEPYAPRKEINTALTTGKAEPIVEPKATMKPIAGPPVYYPQGKEMFTKSEQSEAGWRAQGGWAKGSGKYEYESASKSKSSSKSGAAVVPVCLPLCCAMPCSIM